MLEISSFCVWIGKNVITCDLKIIGRRSWRVKGLFFHEKLDGFSSFSRADSSAGRGEEGRLGRERQKKNRNEGPRVAIRDYRCPEMLINLVLTLGLLLVIKQPWILLKSPTLYSSLAAFYLSFLCACINPDTLAATGPTPRIFPSLWNQCIVELLLLLASFLREIFFTWCKSISFVTNWNVFRLI